MTVFSVSFLSGSTRLKHSKIQVKHVMGKSLKAESCQVTSISCEEIEKMRIPKVSYILAWLLWKQFSIIL